MVRLRLAVLIPALNEEGTIASTIKGALEHGDVFVVDDASTDSTVLVAKNSGATVIENNKNLGYDKSLDVGMAFIFNEHHNYTHILTMDADGQHKVEDIKGFKKAALGGADVVIGKRCQTLPRIAEKLFSLYFKLAYGISDPLCGMKLYNKRLYVELGHFDSYRSIGTELLTYALKNKYKAEEISISVNSRVGKPRFGSSMTANLKIMRSLFFCIFKKN